MSAVQVSEIRSVRELLENPACVERLANAARTATRPQSADEFLSDLPLRLRLAAKPAQMLGQELGLQSRTEDGITVAHRYGHVLLGLLCGVVAQSISLEQIEERVEAENCLVTGVVPSSPLSMEGEFTAHVAGRQGEYRVDCTVTFKGQKFAWGRGKRILKTLFQDLERHAAEFEREGL